MPTITRTTVPGQQDQHDYGVDADGNLYTWSDATGSWWRENMAQRLTREARAAGMRSTIERETPAWRYGENWMVRNRKAQVAR